MPRIVRIHAYGDASVLKLEDIDVPAPGTPSSDPAPVQPEF